MKRKFVVLFAGALVVLLTVAMVGCGSDEKKSQATIIDDVVDTVAATVATNLKEARVADAALPSADSIKVISLIGDMLIQDAKLYAAFDGGVVVYDFDAKSYTVAASGEKLNAVAVHQEKVYVGGTRLFTVEDAALQPVTADFEGEIESLHSFDDRLMIGTDNGLYATGAGGDEFLLGEVTVTAIASDPGGLWVGTRGDGLYRWDGDEFRRRHLRRDTTLFDYVNSLDFSHDHLYMGTPNGFHIYDGGRWETLTALDGLPSDNVTMVDASNWVVYMATDEGVISYFDGDFIPVRKLNEKPANAVRVYGRKVLAATDYDGILMKSGDMVKTLVPADNGMNYNILSLVP